MDQGNSACGKKQLILLMFNLLIMGPTRGQSFVDVLVHLDVAKRRG